MNILMKGKTNQNWFINDNKNHGVGVGTSTLAVVIHKDQRYGCRSRWSVNQNGYAPSPHPRQILKWYYVMWTINTTVLEAMKLYSYNICNCLQGNYIFYISTICNWILACTIFIETVKLKLIIKRCIRWEKTYKDFIER